MKLYTLAQRISKKEGGFHPGSAVNCKIGPNQKTQSIAEQRCLVVKYILVFVQSFDVAYFGKQKKPLIVCYSESFLTIHLKPKYTKYSHSRANI